MKKIITISITIIILSTFVYSFTEDEYIYKSGIKFYRLKKFEYAVREFNKLLGEYPESVYAHKALYFKGISEFYLAGDKSEDLDLVEDIFNRYIKEYPDGEYFYSALKWIGDIYYYSKDYETALDKYSDALSTHPESNLNDKIMYNQSRCHEKLGKYVLAKTILERILTQYPETTLKKQIDFDIKRLEEVISK